MQYKVPCYTIMIQNCMLRFVYTVGQLQHMKGKVLQSRSTTGCTMSKADNGVNVPLVPVLLQVLAFLCLLLYPCQHQPAYDT